MRNQSESDCPYAEEVNVLFRQAGAVHAGHFLVPAGHHTSEFWEKFAVLQHPPTAFRLFELMANMLRGVEADLVAGPSRGGMIVAFGVAAELGLPAAFVERDDRTGLFFLRRGTAAAPGQRVIVVDDVISSGETLRLVHEAVEARALEVAASAVFVDRRLGVSGNPGRDLAVTSLLRVSSPRSVPPRECEQCLRRDPLLDPRTMLEISPERGGQ